MPIVSVIIPTYNHRNFVLATLDSVFAQTFTDYEVIVINDGSPDDTADILRPLAEAGRIRYIEQENTGQSIARNHGIEAAQGEFIALLDDDDLWPPDKLEWQVEAMARYPEAGVVGGPTNIVDASGHYLSRIDFSPDISFESCFLGSPFISPGQTLIRACVLQQVGGLNPDIWGADDLDLWLRIVKNSRIVMEDRDALFYRRHTGNASNNLCRMFDNTCLVLDIHLADVPDKDRKRVLRMAYNWLYNYLGKLFVLKIKEAARSGDIRMLPAYFSRLGKLGKVLMRDPFAVLRFVRDFLPSQWGRQLHRPTLLRRTSS